MEQSPTRPGAYRIAVAIFAALAECVAAGASASDLEIARQAQRLLSDRCFKCHGPDEQAREAELRLDVASGMTHELPSGEIAVVPGDLAASALVERISSDDDALKMPPADSGKSLSSDEIELLKQWVESGAPFAQHWAYVKPVRPAVPAIDDQWIRNPIDAFVLKSLRDHGLTPSPAADAERLLRRLSFDLTGLPPTPADIDAFVAADSPAAAKKLFDRLTASPHYGERMAADWLDLARYADSNGYQNDFARNAWPWRDWIIAAYNSNMPYDQFLTEQLAGDLLPNATSSQKLATGFNRNHRTVTEAGSIDEEWRVENVVDRVETTSTAALGLTMGCARCHDHRYDPISQREFYQFYAFFNSVNEKGVYTEQRGNVPPLMTVPSTSDERLLADLSQTIGKFESRLASQKIAVDASFQDWLSQLSSPSTPPSPAISIPLEGDASARLPDGKIVAPANVASLPEWDAAAKPIAAQFNGDQAIEYADLVALESDKPFAFSALVKRTGQGAIFSQMDDRSDFRGVDLVILEDDRLACHLIHRWPDDSIKIIARTLPPKDKWFHVALSYDGSRDAGGVHLYVNGKLADVDVEHNSLRHNFSVGQPLRLGRRMIERPFHGELCAVKLFDEAIDGLTLSQRILADLVPLTADAAPLDDRRRELLWDLYTATSTDKPVVAFQKTEAKLLAARSERESLEKKLPTAMIMEELSNPRPTFVLKRGLYDQPDADQPVHPDVPAFLPRLPEGAPANRLGLAAWVVSPDNPLTARVAVNRLWKQFFDVGLVKTPENFDVQAEPPSHPELLDWLAVELIESGWNIQHIQWLIVDSAAYRQSSDASPDSYARDPENRLLSRGPRFRLSAEMIRDNALTVSGLLNPKIGGASIMPYQPLGLWEDLAGGAHEDYVQVHGDDLYRRSLYVYRKRTVPHPSLGTFDAPSWEICQARRATTNTPLQSLALLNDVAYVEAARKLAERIIAEGSDDDRDRISVGFRLATGRRPSPRETSELFDALREYRRAMKNDSSAAKLLLTHGESPVASNIAAEELAAHTLLAGVLLNLDEAVTKN